MATPKKNAKGFSSDSEDEKLSSKAQNSNYDEDDDFDSMQLDEFDPYDSENDYEDDDD